MFPIGAISCGSSSIRRPGTSRHPTGFAPGPVIGELGGFKIKAGIDAGKVVIKEDKIVAQEGEVVNDKLAGLLLRLGIEPMEIGLNLIAVYENGGVLPGKVLDIDEEQYKKDFCQMAAEAFNLAVFAGITNKDTIEPLIAMGAMMYFIKVFLTGIQHGFPPWDYVSAVCEKTILA